MSARRIIVGLVIVAALVVIVLVLAQRLLSRAQDSEDFAPETVDGPVLIESSIVTAEGRLVPLRDADLSFPVEGQLADILVEEGDRVETGQPLMRLKTDAQEIILSQAQADLAVAEARLEVAQRQLDSARAGVSTAELGVLAAKAQLTLLTAGPLPEEIEAAEKNISAAQSGVSQATGNQSAALTVPESAIRAAEAQVAAALAEAQALQDAYNTIIDLCFETPSGDEVCPLYGPTEENTRAELEAARLRLDAAQAGLDALSAGATPAQRQAAAGAVVLAQANRDLSEAQLEQLRAGPTPEQIRQAEVRVAQATAMVEQAVSAVAQAAAAVSQAEAGVSTAQSMVEAAQAALDRMTLKAIFSGTVGEVNVAPGEQVFPGTLVVTLADLSKWRVETTDLTELDISAVNVGQSAQVQLEAIPDEILEGSVIDIARVKRQVGSDVTYVVTIRLEERPDLPLRWGMTVMADIDAH